MNPTGVMGPFDCSKTFFTEEPAGGGLTIPPLADAEGCLIHEPLTGRVRQFASCVAWPRTGLAVENVVKRTKAKGRGYVSQFFSSLAYENSLRESDRIATGCRSGI